MYPVSEAFLRTVQENTRSYHWTGQITTKSGTVYLFVYEDIVKGSGYITAQCCGSAEIQVEMMISRAEYGHTALGKEAEAGQAAWEEKIYPPFYMHTLSYAMEHGWADDYLESRKRNLDCKKAIEDAIRKNFDGMHLAQDAAEGVLEEYGAAWSKGLREPFQGRSVPRRIGYRCCRVLQWKFERRCFFSALHGEALKIAGIPVDINPISTEKTGTLEEYLEGAGKYLDEKEWQQLTGSIVKFGMDYGEDLLEFWNGDARIETEPIYQAYEIIDNALERNDTEKFEGHLAEIIKSNNKESPIAKDAMALMEKLTGKNYNISTETEATIRFYKEIGFPLEDVSIYDGNFDLMVVGEMQTEFINEISQYRENLLKMLRKLTRAYVAGAGSSLF